MKATLAAVCIAVMTAGCMSPHSSHVAEVAPLWDGWTAVWFDNADTTASLDINIIIRYDDTFTADALPLQISTTTPSGGSFVERFVLHLPHRHSAASLANQTVVPYRKAAVFSASGRYRMAFKPETPVTGVEAIGINIEKNE